MASRGRRCSKSVSTHVSRQAGGQAGKREANRQGRQPDSYVLLTNCLAAWLQILWVVLALEHALLLLKLGVAAKIADVPLWVRKTDEYQKYLQKRDQGQERAKGDGQAAADELSRVREELDAESDDEHFFI
jgi:hypothetical protein